MTRTAAALLGLVLCFGTGCFVFDEIDEGRAIMKKHSGQYPDAKPRSEPAAEGEEEEEDGPGLLARVQGLIRSYREPKAPERSADDGVVRCDFEGGVTFTHESDCLSRGGRVQR